MHKKNENFYMIELGRGAAPLRGDTVCETTVSLRVVCVWLKKKFGGGIGFSASRKHPQVARLANFK